MLNSLKCLMVGTRAAPLASCSRNIAKQTATSRSLCVCGTSYKNYSEKQLRFNGVHVTLHKPYDNIHDFETDLIELLNRWETSDGRRSAFLEVPITQSDLIAVAARYGFTFHHARNDKAVLSVWLDKHAESKLPHFANHTLGAAGACFNKETQEVLMVKDKGRYSNWWKFPGGFSERGEFIGETAVRETFEETGIHSSFESIISFGEMHGQEFDQSGFFFICRLHPLSFDVNPCPDEIVDCRWFTLHHLLDSTETTPFVKRVCQVLCRGVDNDNDFSDVDISGQETASWLFPERKFRFYHRTMEDQKKS